MEIETPRAPELAAIIYGEEIPERSLKEKTKLISLSVSLLVKL